MIPAAASPCAEPALPHLAGAPLEIALSSRQGERDRQQDHGIWKWTESGLLIAALFDGMGSLPGSGEVARIAGDCVLAVAALPFTGSTRRAAATLRAASALTREHTESEDGDTTAVLAVIDPAAATVDGGWIGDSRLYVFDDDSILHLKSTDHNLAHDRSVLTRSLVGGHGHLCERHPCEEHAPDSTWWPGAGGSARVWRVILTTDGVHDVLTHDEMQEIVEVAVDAGHTARRLTAFALRKAGRDARARGEERDGDNATALVVEFPPFRHTAPTGRA